MSETTPARLLGMSGSLRSGSYSNAVLETLREKFEGRADLRIYDLAPIPAYNQDLEGERRPEPVKQLLAGIAESDGLVLCAPEFNHSIPGVLKNALDWASRPAFTSVMAYKPVAIMATSRGPLGGARCLEHMRVALELDAGAGYPGAGGDDHRVFRQDPRRPARRRNLSRLRLRRSRSTVARDPFMANGDILSRGAGNRSRSHRSYARALAARAADPGPRLRGEIYSAEEQGGRR